MEVSLMMEPLQDEEVPPHQQLPRTLMMGSKPPQALSWSQPAAAGGHEAENTAEPPCQDQAKLHHSTDPLTKAACPCSRRGGSATSPRPGCGASPAGASSGLGGPGGGGGDVPMGATEELKVLHWLGREPQVTPGQVSLSLHGPRGIAVSPLGRPPGPSEGPRAPTGAHVCRVRTRACPGTAHGCAHTHHAHHTAHPVHTRYRYTEHMHMDVHAAHMHTHTHACTPPQAPGIHPSSRSHTPTPPCLKTHTCAHVPALGAHTHPARLHFPRHIGAPSACTHAARRAVHTQSTQACPPASTHMQSTHMCMHTPHMYACTCTNPCMYTTPTLTHACMHAHCTWAHVQTHMQITHLGVHTPMHTPIHMQRGVCVCCMHHAHVHAHAMLPVCTHPTHGCPQPHLCACTHHAHTWMHTYALNMPCCMHAHTLHMCTFPRHACKPHTCACTPPTYAHPHAHAHLPYTHSRPRPTCNPPMCMHTPCTRHAHAIHMLCKCRARAMHRP